MGETTDHRRGNTDPRLRSVRGIGGGPPRREALLEPRDEHVEEQSNGSAMPSGLRFFWRVGNWTRW